VAWIGTGEGSFRKGGGTGLGKNWGSSVKKKNRDRHQKTRGKGARSKSSNRGYYQDQGRQVFQKTLSSEKPGQRGLKVKGTEEVKKKRSPKKTGNFRRESTGSKGGMREKEREVVINRGFTR